jgi:phosphoglycolate phosphatase
MELREERPLRELERDVVIFDFDGTIADTKASILSTATTVLSRWGFGERDLQRVGELIGPPFPQAFEWVFGLTVEDAVEVTRQYREIYNNLGIEAWPAFPGIVDLLGELHDAGRTLAVASSKRTYLVERGLADNGVLNLFDVVCAREADSDSTKADAIREALERLGRSAGQAVMVGDRYHDVEAAIACGVPCIGVLYGKTADRAELEGAGAAAVVDTVEGLRTLLLT